MASAQPNAVAGSEPPANQNEGDVLKVSRMRVIYDSGKDSGLAKCGRWASCACMGQKTMITGERIRTQEWHGCSRIEKAMDIDNIKDMQLRETCGVCLCLCGRGTIRVFGQDQDQKEEYFDCRYIEQAGEVFLQITELNYKLNNLKFGMARPDDKSLPDVLYSSKEDTAMVKCLRTLLCGCLRPTTVITKSGVTMSVWKGASKVTKRMDFDNIKDVSLRQDLCDACCNTGTLRVYGQDEDQKDEYFDISWISKCKPKMRNIRRHLDLLNNRDRVGFTG